MQVSFEISIGHLGVVRAHAGAGARAGERADADARARAHGGGVTFWMRLWLPAWRCGAKNGCQIYSNRERERENCIGQLLLLLLYFIYIATAALEENKEPLKPKRLSLIIGGLFDGLIIRTRSFRSTLPFQIFTFCAAALLANIFFKFLSNYLWSRHLSLRPTSLEDAYKDHFGTSETGPAWSWHLSMLRRLCIYALLILK